MIFANFKSNLVLENNGKQNPDLYYRNKYWKHVACSYDYMLVCVFKSNFDEDAKCDKRK